MFECSPEFISTITDHKADNIHVHPFNVSGLLDPLVLGRLEGLSSEPRSALLLALAGRTDAVLTLLHAALAQAGTAPGVQAEKKGSKNSGTLHRVYVKENCEIALLVA